MENFDIYEYYKTFKEYAQYLNDDTRISEVKTLKLCMDSDIEEATQDTIELIEEGKLPTYENMELVLCLAALIADRVVIE